MRFAYIDSQGKEVGIPTVEALQLRIELGAITEETIFYDASKDRWDPAGEHEIFRTLSREIRERGEEGPRPPTPRAVSSPEVEPPPRPRAPDPFEKEQDPLADTAPPGEVDWVEAELEELHGPQEPRETEPDEESVSAPDPGDDWDADLAGFGSLDLAPDLMADSPGGPELVADPSGEPDPAADAPGDPGEDLGVGADLELERPLAEELDEESAVTADPEMELETPLARLEPGPEGEWDEPEEGWEGSEGPGVGERVQEPAGTGAGVVGAPPGPGAPPIDADDADGSERIRADEEALRRERARKDPYDRRARGSGDAARRRPPRRAPRRRGPSAGMVAAVVAMIAALGVGGWFGWSALRGSADATAAGDTVPVLPPLPADLESATYEVADSAWDDMLDTLRAMAERAELPPEPNPDWLAGIYLANAGDYPDVPAYWEALRAHLDRVRAADEDAFLAGLRARLEGSEAVPPESRDTVVARARAGFRAGAPEREVVYDHLENLIAVALDLHNFLVGNEADIEYEPAVGLSRDPVTEAIPSNPALGEEMWDRVGEIPTALESLGTLDRVTTERILEVFHRRLSSVGIR